jgi:protein-S-isoprenylcysteine O-methyltransferase Ste14
MSQPEQRKGERRAPFMVDEAKFSTQRLVTYVILLIFTAVTANVLIGQDQAERSTIIQTVINFAMLAIGFWLGASKQAQDNAQSASRIAEAINPPPQPPKAEA